MMCKAYVDHCNDIQESIYNFKVLQMSNSEFSNLVNTKQIDIPAFIILPLQV